MAWQVLAVNVSGDSPLVREPTDDQYHSLGTPDEVRRRIDAFFAHVDWSDRTSGHFIAEDHTFTLVFSSSGQGAMQSLMIDVRGGQESIPALVGFAKSNGWQLYDCSGGWLDLDHPSSDGWSGYDRLRRSHRSRDQGDGQS